MIVFIELQFIPFYYCSIVKNKLLFASQGSIIIFLFWDYINSTILGERYKEKSLQEIIINIIRIKKEIFDQKYKISDEKIKC